MEKCENLEFLKSTNEWYCNAVGELFRHNKDIGKCTPINCDEYIAKTHPLFLI